MRSLGSLITSVICSVILIIINTCTFYDKFTAGNSYFWINGILGVVFILFLIRDMKDIVKKNYRTSAGKE
ncbi:hypothetical protein CN450_24890 [Bacillus cereus]|nr:hypothetical protein [Bacillus cereus]PEX80716.1 hypothetical protein CN450_24890 [Bacillus cereus]